VELKTVNIEKYYDQNIVTHTVHSNVTFSPINLSDCKNYNFTNRVRVCACDYVNMRLHDYVTIRLCDYEYIHGHTFILPVSLLHTVTKSQGL